MLKRGITILIIILLLAIPIKAETSTDLIQFQIKQAYIENNLINIKLESQDQDFLIHIKIEGDNIQAYYSNQILPKHTTKTFKFSTDLNHIHKVTITPYRVINNENVLYYYSEQSYIIDDYIEQQEIPEQLQIPPTEEIQEKPTFFNILKDLVSSLFKEESSQAPLRSQEPVTEKVYIYGNGLIASKDNNQEINYYHKDHLGSTRAITNQEGDIEFSSDFYPFGNSYNEVGDTEYTYTGKQKDNTGLFYYGARYYDADLGRFTQIDPILNPSESPYAYVKNNPMKFIDPTGNKEITINKGESLWRKAWYEIGRKEGHTWSEYSNVLESLNPWLQQLPNSNPEYPSYLVRPGDVIKLPVYEDDTSPGSTLNDVWSDLKNDVVITYKEEGGHKLIFSILSFLGVLPSINLEGITYAETTGVDVRNHYRAIEMDIILDRFDKEGIPIEGLDDKQIRKIAKEKGLIPTMAEIDEYNEIPDLIEGEIEYYNTDDITD